MRFISCLLQTNVVKSKNVTYTYKLSLMLKDLSYEKPLFWCLKARSNGLLDENNLCSKATVTPNKKLWFENEAFILETDENRENEKFRIFTTNKESTVFELSSWNLVKRITSFFCLFDQVSWWELKNCIFFISSQFWSCPGSGFLNQSLDVICKIQVPLLWKFEHAYLLK